MNEITWTEEDAETLQGIAGAFADLLPPLLSGADQGSLTDDEQIIDEGPKPCERCGRTDDKRDGDYWATDRGVEVWYQRLCDPCDGEVHETEETDRRAHLRYGW